MKNLKTLYLPQDEIGRVVADAWEEDLRFKSDIRKR